MLTRDAILAAAAPALGRLDVPEWGGEVALRHMTLDDLLAWQAAREDSRQHAAAVLVRLAVAGENGAALFGEADLPMLVALPGIMLNRIATAVLEFNGMTDRQQAATAGN